IKRQERSRRRSPRAVARIAAGPNSWSKSVRSWVVEFQKRDRTESQPTFGSLFTDSPPEQLADSD
ncbi:MAG TPA: hypothetical protein VFU37_02640, partial [Pyrinomonadaceae bacterium]|nr:hypothetical protein [Pyrinomonadaceae bacterium]